MSRVLYRGGVVHSPVDDGATALMLEGDTIAWVGRDQDPEADGHGADEVVELAGALVTPAFVDTHVHVTATGVALDGLDLSGCPSLREALRRLAEHAAARPAEILIGHGWDETRWPERRPPTAAELDAATGGAACYLSRTDAHSGAVSTALLAAVPQARAQAGFDPGGLVRLDAHHTIRRYAFDCLTAQQRRRIQRRTLQEAARRGIGCLHENAAPGLSSEDDLSALLELARGEPLPEVIGYWGEIGAAALAHRHGLAGLAGDLLADGSIGSHTACLTSPYADAPGNTGHAYRTVEEVAQHVLDCTREGLQAGFHAIGDGALRTVLRGFEEAEARIGTERVRAGRHRLEHVEMLDADMIAVMARLGIAASVQPIADTLWGGTGGMYADRLGVERVGSMNPFRALLDAGVPLALSSDSPIMPMGPWQAVRAAVGHHNPEQRITVTEAVRAHTAGGRRAAGRDESGCLEPGAPASITIWDCPALDPGTRLPDMEAGTDDPTCLQTVVRGRTIHTL
ncbi:amidohydrolase [Actinomadura formosensis]|uniref:amidohydrolase n=1 Tax=Actinomadura formosensis TaxID=60706 RepID=UPI00082CB3C6|nr:amidohydrolase [Actinomadura formosensis]